MTVDAAERDAVYVLGCAKSMDNTNVAVATSDVIVRTFDVQTLRPLASMKGHTARINDIQTAASSPHLSVSCGKDGYSALWDARTGNCVLNVRYGDGALHSCSLGCADTLLALGSSNGVLFFDVRAASGAASFTGQESPPQGALLGQYVDSHYEDVLRVRFHPNRTTSLITGGADGLACVFDVSKQSEDEALNVVMNAGSDVVNVRVIDDADLVFCHTSIEGIALFDAASGQSCGMIPNFRGRVQDEVKFNAEYIIDATWDRGHGAKIHVLAGNHSGDIAEVALGSDGSMHGMSMLRGGHYRDVRCAEWIVPNSSSNAVENHILFTGGEDGRLCQWKKGNHPGVNPFNSGYSEKPKARVKGGHFSGRVSKHASRAKKRQANPY